MIISPLLYFWKCHRFSECFLPFWRLSSYFPCLWDHWYWFLENFPCSKYWLHLFDFGRRNVWFLQREYMNLISSFLSYELGSRLTLKAKVHKWCRRNRTIKKAVVRSRFRAHTSMHQTLDLSLLRSSGWWSRVRSGCITKSFWFSWQTHVGWQFDRLKSWVLICRRQQGLWRHWTYGTIARWKTQLFIFQPSLDSLGGTRQHQVEVCFEVLCFWRQQCLSKVSIDFDSIGKWFRCCFALKLRYLPFSCSKGSHRFWYLKVRGPFGSFILFGIGLFSRSGWRCFGKPKWPEQ